MADLAVALRRGWDGHAGVAHAILILRSFKYGRTKQGHRLTLADDGRLSDDDCHALELLRAHGFTTWEPINDDDLLGFSGSIYTATEAGEKAHARLVELWREHRSNARASLVETRQTVRWILLEGIYHDRSPLKVTYKDPGVEYSDRPWLQLAGSPLEPSDVGPELRYLVDTGLLTYKRDSIKRDSSPGQRSEIIDAFDLTREGTDRVESQRSEASDELDRDMKPSLGSSQTVVNHFHAQANVHNGSGDLNVGLDPVALGQFATQLHAFTASLAFPDDAGRAELTTKVEALRVETDQRRAAKLTQRIRELVGKASGPLKEIAIGVIDAELGKMTGTQ